MRYARRWCALPLLAVAALLAVACGSNDGGGTGVTATPTTDARTPLERLISAYPDPDVDPSAEAWEQLLSDEAFETQPVAVVEFVRLQDADDARTAYNSYLEALAPAIESAGGEMVSINDTWRPGLEQPAGFEGGVSWIAEFPSISAYVDVMLDERVLAVAELRRGAVAEAGVLMGPNLLPDVIRQLGPNDDPSAFPSDRVQGKSAEQLVDELLAIYPSGGADPTAETLRAIAEFDGFETQRVHFINLYQFNDDPGGGATALSEYNAAALPVVLAHGGRPKVLANVRHHLVGLVRWDRFIFVSWPSLAVFTDLRLDPQYVEAQRDRVVSADVYGNLITIARADRPSTAPD